MNTNSIPPSRKRVVGSTIQVNPKQKGNPLLTFLQNQPWEYVEVVPDFIIGQSACALFLSLQYHRLHPEYISTRFREIKLTHYDLKILLIYVDLDAHQSIIREINRQAIYHGINVLLAWSWQDAAKYLETLKQLESKPPDQITESTNGTHFGSLTQALTSIKSVNKTDVVTLASHFESVYDIVHAPVDKLVALPGFGDQKVKRLREAFETPFLMDK